MRALSTGLTDSHVLMYIQPLYTCLIPCSQKAPLNTYIGFQTARGRPYNDVLSYMDLQLERRGTAVAVPNIP
jgi:hypothetical protein